MCMMDSRSKTQTGSRQTLLICFFGIFVSYFVYGVLQENITRSRYGPDNERYTYTTAMVFIQCIVNAIFAQLAIRTSKPERDTSPQWLYAIMSFSYLGAMLASNHALQFVSYPTQVLGKSVKPIPVMILGVLLARKSYPLSKYLFVLMITLGVALFMYKPLENRSKVSDTESSVGWGELLLLLSLALDGVTGGVQDKLRAEHKTQTHRMMLWMNLWSLAYSLIGLLLTGEGFEFVTFVMKYPSVLLQLILFSVCSAVGQNFIFMTITNFGPLTCSVMTTTRKFFTILGSVLFFRNPLSLLQWLGTILVFAGLTLDSYFSKGSGKSHGVGGKAASNMENGGKIDHPEGSGMNNDAELRKRL